MSSVVPVASPPRPRPKAMPLKSPARQATLPIKNPERSRESQSGPPPSPPPGIGLIRQHEKRRRDKRITITTLATAVILIAIIGTLSVLLYLQSQKKTVVSVRSDPVESVENGSGERDVNGGDSAPESDRPSDASRPRHGDTPPHDLASDRDPIPEKTEKRVRLDDLPPQKFSYLKKKRVEECWERVQPHLVSLKVFDGRGTHAVSATLIDSRGWIVTSYSAVAGATKIEVTASAKSIDDLPDPSLLTDRVRGVIAMDPKNDIAILSINRRFVVSFAEMKINETQRLVAGQYLVQSAPPSPLNPYSRSESKIIARSTYDELDPAGQARAKQENLTDPDVNWLVAQYQSIPCPGTALVLIDGSLAAINAFTTDQKTYYVMVDHLKGLIQSADVVVRPLSVLAGKDGNARLTAVEDDHPMREVSVRLNQLGTVCEAFGWSPQTKMEYSQFQDFADYTSRALRFSLDNRDNPREKDQVKKIEDQVKHWEKSLARQLGKINFDDPQSLARLNEFAETEISRPNRYVPFFGKVLLSGIELPDHVLLEFDNLPVVVNIPFSPDGEPMLPDSRWLFFVKTPPTKKKVKFNVVGRSIVTHSVGLQFAVGPID